MKATPVSNATILLVDDNNDGLMVRRTLLQELGYCVETAPNPDEALKILGASHVDLIVTDYKMPRMSGVELIGRIREGHPNVRVILVSGFVDPLGLTEENTGADSVIVKSSREPAHLVRAVKRLLNRPPQRKPPRMQGGGGRVRTGTRGHLAN